MRPEERRQTRRTLNVTNQPTVRTEVNARPVTNFVNPQVKQSRLLQALQAINPAIQKYAKDRDETAIAQGRQAAIDEVSVEEAAAKVKSGEWLKEQNPYFQIGYMNYYGQRAARKSVRDLSSSFENDFNPDTDDIDQFLSDYTARDLAGNQDEEFLRGYSPVMEAAKAKIRDQYTTYQTEKISAEVDDGISQNIEAALLASREDGGATVTPADFAALKSDAVDFFDKTPKEFEEIAFSTIHKLGMQGHPEVYDIFYEKRQDGTPGLAHTKRWGEKITQAKMAATSVALTGIRAQQKADEDAEKALQVQAETKIMTKILAGEDATQLIKTLQPNLKQSTARSLFDFQQSYTKSASDIIQDPKMFGDMLSLIVRGDFDTNELNQMFRYSVATGRGLTPQDYSNLINMNERLNSNRAKQMGNSGAIQANKNYLLGQYSVTSQYLLPQDSSAVETQKAAARLLYDQRVATYINKNPTVDLSDPDVHDVFNKYALEAVKLYPPPQDIFRKYANDIPQEYQGKGGRAKLADDRSSGKISDEFYREMYPKTSP